MSILVLDNYDSFTYNLVHLLKSLGAPGIEVHRNDKISLDEVARFDKILLSPGPGIPLEAGIMPLVVKKYAPTRKILGVCLGHQCIGEVFGGTLNNLKRPVHGKAVISKITKRDEPLFNGVPDSFPTGRYHSWVVSHQEFPSDLVVTAEDSEGYIMALSHRTYDVKGVQFHPESVLTEHGATIMKNWLA